MFSLVTRPTTPSRACSPASRSRKALALAGHGVVLAKPLDQPALVADRYPQLLSLRQLAARCIAHDQVIERLRDIGGDLAAQRLDGRLRLSARQAGERAGQQEGLPSER